MDIQKITRLQSLLDLPDKYHEKENVNRSPSEKTEDDTSENQSIFDYLDL